MNRFFQFRLRPWGVLTAGGAIAAAASLAGFFGRFAWWLDIASHFRVQYAVGFVLLGLCFYLGRRKHSAAAALCFAVLNAVPVIAFLLPPAGRYGSHENVFRAILINVNTQTGNPQKVIAFIEQQNPDIVVLEEISDEWVNALSELLDSYPFRLIEPRSDNFGIALLCRLDVESAEVVSFGQAAVPSLVAQMRRAEHTITLIATHPLPPAGALYSALRNEQLARIAQWVRSLDGPVLLLGDLNTTPWSYHYHAFIRTSGLENASKGRGLHPTWPTFAPPLWIPLDHALHTDDIVILKKTVGPDVGSDHYPIRVDFSLGASKE